TDCPCSSGTLAPGGNILTRINADQKPDKRGYRKVGIADRGHAPRPHSMIDPRGSALIRVDPRLIRLFQAPGWLAARGCQGRFGVGPGFDEAEVDLAILQAGAQDHDADAVAEAVLVAAAVAGERLADRVELVVVAGQLGHVDQAVDLGFVQFDEQAEAGDAADGAVELAANVFLHPRRAIALVD